MSGTVETILRRERDEAFAVLAEIRASAIALVEAIERLGLRVLVAGWNGEGRPIAERFGPHPDELCVNLPTNCGTVYAIDKATVAAREALGQKDTAA